MSTCATSAPTDLVTSATNSYAAIEDTLVATYPVTINSSAPPQESGHASAPSALAPAAPSSDGGRRGTRLDRDPYRRFD
jgi:hypothetical protein